MNITLLTAATATNGAPTLVSEGVSLSGAGIMGDRGRIYIYSTAGSVTMTVTIRLWGWSAVSAAWHPLVTGADATKGVLNAAAAIGETSPDFIAHSEVVEGLETVDRVYAEITAIGGTSTAISATLVARS